MMKNSVTFIVILVAVVVCHQVVEARPTAKLGEIDAAKNMIKKAGDDATLVLDNSTNQLRVRSKTAPSSDGGDDETKKKVLKNNALLKSGNTSDGDDYEEDEDYDYVAPIINIKFNKRSAADNNIKFNKRSAADNRTNWLAKADEESKDDDDISINSRPMERRSNSALTKSHRRKNRRRKLHQKQQKDNVS
jgi:hypothetical protein